MRGIVVIVVALLALPAFAYQADLVPAGRRAGSRDLTGQLSIGGADGSVHATIDNVNDTHGNPLDATLVVHLRVRVNGLRRRINLPLEVSGGSGDANDNLGLRPGDKVIVNDARVRDPDHRTVAEAGVVTADVTSEPTPPSEPPASLAQCQADLVSCNDELDQCNTDLDDCVSSE